MAASRQLYHADAQAPPGSCAMAESESGQVPSTEGNVTIDLEADAKRWDFERHLRL